jgi:tetratricopeptide (TPR) repeat protein
MNLQIERLKRLPQRQDDTWQGGLVRAPMWIKEETNEKPYRPWLAVWISTKTGAVHSSEPQKDKTFKMALNTLTNLACNRKLAGYRPGKLSVKDPALAEHLGGLLSEADIAVEQRDRLFTFDEMLADMADKVAGPDLPPNQMDVKGITVEMMHSFAEAACQFYKAQLWQYLTDEDLIEIESPFADAGLRYTTVLGAGRQVFGLSFYESEKDLETLLEGGDSVSLAKEKHWTLFFDPITEIPFGDADIWEDHNLPVATPDAYPIAMSYEPKRKHRRPGPDILVFLEGLMRALAQTTEEEIDSGRWEKKVPTFRGEKQFVLSLPDFLRTVDKATRDKAKIRRGMPDRRSMERTHVDIQRLLDGHNFKNLDEMRDFVNKNVVGKKVPHKAAVTAIEQAQDIIYDAFDARGRKQLQLARKALEIYPNCADAYVLLAERCSDVQKACDYYAQGVAAGERALGEEFFKKEAGNFWGILETRPYMRARLGLAQCLEEMGQLDEAAGHYRQMLQLNPNDNQGVRELLLTCLLKMKEDIEAEELLKRYKNDSDMALWSYAKALVAFRQKGDTATARNQLKKAIAVNKYVPKYLLGYEELPDISPASYRLGSKEEAMICAEQLTDVWENTQGADEWLEARK